MFILSALISFLIASQQEFLGLPQKLKVAINDANCSDIEISFAPGVYYYPDNFLSVCDIDRPDQRITFVGNNSLFIASDEGDSAYAFEKGYVDQNSLHHVDTWTEMKQAYLWPIPIPFSGHKFFLFSSEEHPRKKEDLAGCDIMLTQWYIGARYPVERIGRHFIIFTRSPKYHTHIWSELRFGRCFPRYALCRPPSDDSGLYACKSTCFLSVVNSSLKSLEISGMRFLGNGDGPSGWLLYYDNCKADNVSISDCGFEGIRSGGVSVRDTDNFLLQGCRFERCYKSCVYVRTDSKNSLIRDNNFINDGRLLSNAPVVDCKGDDFRITHNYFEDFSYSAIGLGCHFTEPDTCGMRGVVEDNEICMSESFRNQKPFRGLIDSGSIYVWTKNNGLIIRNNFIHDIAGPHGNRGILCDDGATNVRIENNRILRIRKSFCIDLRRRLRIERKKNSVVQKVNIGNIMKGNIVDGRCRFEIRRNDPTSFKGKNIVLK